MSAPQPTPQEKLDQLLRDDKIDEEEYRQLSKALSGARPEPRSSSAPETPRTKRLTKSWSNRQLEGVCGGLAQYFNIDPTIVRVIAVVLLFVVPPVTLIAYLAFSLVLPWDEPLAAKTPGRKSHPWAFGTTLFLLLFVVPVLLATYVLPRFVDIFISLGARLPDASRFAINMLDHYRNNPGAGFASAGIAAGLTGIYLLGWTSRLRGSYVILCLVVATAWPLYLFLAVYIPLLSLQKIIQ